MQINHAERAFRAWPVLAAVATSPQAKITYGDLAARIGVHHRAVRYILGLIQDYCLSEKLPPLTIVVVNGQDGLPGTGFIAWDADDLATGFKQVSGFRWDLRENPFEYAAGGETEEQLAEGLASASRASADVYALIKVRGVAQSVFRKALLLAYQRRCAFCGMSFEAALQAAHIVPWSACNPEQRMALNNGLLLCATHHRMFDAGLMTLGPDYTVQYEDPNSEERSHSVEDRVVSVDLDGRAPFMPKLRAHWPCKEALSEHYRLLSWDF